MTAAVASAVFAGSAYAAGLGKLTVLSALGQPLRAEIELTSVSPEEAQGLVAKLASPDAFRLANIEFNPALLSLRFDVEQRNGRQVIRITSSQPLNEPFVDMLLELSWNSGRLVREYTFLLDPAELRTTQSAQVSPTDVLRQGAATQRPATPAAQPTTPAPAADTARREAPARQPAGETAKSIDEYRVKRGDTLGKIAAQTKPTDVSLDMMLVALYRANPDAFIGHNMNRLKSGTILAIPDSDAIKGTGEGEAHSTVVAHAADFNAYRAKLAGQVAASEPTAAPEPSQTASGKITARVQEKPTAANEATDQLKLSRAAPKAGNAPGTASTSVSAEDRIAKEQALSDAQTRVKELERNVNDLEKLMVVKNKAGADAAKPASVPAASAPAPVASAPAPKPAVKPPVKPVRAPVVAGPSIIDTLMENATYIGGALIALLLGAYAIMARRRKTIADAKAPSEPSILGAPSEQAHSLFAETGGQNVDTNNSVFNSSFAPSASQLDTNEVDPVAEADVYIAYGRDAQAEEILKEALRTHPERLPVRLKLLEIYAARKDQRAFETQASEVYSQTKGEGDEWAQAAALGLSIDPLNPLYAGAAAGGAPASDAERDQQAMLAQELDNALAEDSTDLSSQFAAAVAEPKPTAAPAPAPAAPKDEDHTLDFDLGGLTFEPMSAETPAAPAAPAPAAAAPAPALEPEPEPLPDLSFDMNADATAVPSAPEPSAAEKKVDDLAFDLSFDTPPAIADTKDASWSAPASAPAEVNEPAIESKLEDLNFDFTPQAAPAGGPIANNDISMADLAKEFDLPSIPSEPEPATPAPVSAAQPDALADLDAMNFDIPSVPETPAPATAQAPAAPSFDMDSFGLDLPGTTPAAPAAAASASSLPEPAGFDLSAIDLDLPPATADATALPEVGELSPAHMEMETKLDLAIAYQEIGDKEGARELIDEVIKGGSPEQVAKANAMRAQLA